MYSLEELRKQNRDISELCEVLAVLIEQKSLYSNAVFCELMSRFKEKVWIHLVFEDNTVYAELARDDDPEVRKIAGAFHDSAREIKKRFSGYVRNWCKPVIGDDEHAALVTESREIFSLIRDRIAYENEQMFPLVRESK